MSAKHILEKDTVQVLQTVLSYLQKQDKLNLHPYLQQQHSELIVSCKDLVKRWNETVVHDVPTHRDRTLRNVLSDFGFGVSKNVRPESDNGSFKISKRNSEYQNVTLHDGVVKRKEEFDNVLKQVKFPLPGTPCPMAPRNTIENDLIPRRRTESKTTDDLPEYFNKQFMCNQKPASTMRIQETKPIFPKSPKTLLKCISIVDTVAPSEYHNIPKVLTKDESIPEDVFFTMLAETTCTTVQGWKSIGKFCGIANDKIYILNGKKANKADYIFHFMLFKVEVASFGKCLIFESCGANIWIEFTAHETCDEWYQAIQKYAHLVKNVERIRGKVTIHKCNRSDVHPNIQQCVHRVQKAPNKRFWDPLNG